MLCKVCGTAMRRVSWRKECEQRDGRVMVWVCNEVACPSKGCEKMGVRVDGGRVCIYDSEGKEDAVASE